MSEPDWKDDLRSTVKALTGGSDFLEEVVYGRFMEHIDAAYQRGLEAGRSQAGYSTRRKGKEGPCRTGTAGAAGSIPASNTEGGEP